MSAGKAIMNAIRFIAALLIGTGVVYMWITVRGETDNMILAGVGIGTTLISYVLLYMLGKGGGS